jgi:hypothetical protein
MTLNSVYTKIRTPSLLEKLQSKWGRGDVTVATVATVATVDLFQKPSVASVASTPDEGNTQTKTLIGFDPPHDDDPLLVVLLELGEQICDHWNDSESARAEMNSDILSFPTYQRVALMATLEGSLRADKPRINLDGFTSATGNAKF